MPTSKPRITITLNDHQHQLLHALSELQEVSMSSIVVELLDTVVPVLERMAIVLKAAKDAPASVKESLKVSAEAAEAHLTPHLQDVMSQLDLLVEVGGVAGAAPRSGAAPVTPALSTVKKPRPPTSNRGVRIPQRTPLSQAVSPMKTAKSGRGVKK